MSIIPSLIFLHGGTNDTTTSKGLLVKSAVDTNVYPTGIEVSDAELASVRLEPHDFHGEWNYTIVH